MIFCINKNDLAFCWNGKHNGSAVPPSTEELHVRFKYSGAFLINIFNPRLSSSHISWYLSTTT